MAASMVTVPLAAIATSACASVSEVSPSITLMDERAIRSPKNEGPALYRTRKAWQVLNLHQFSA